MSQFCHVCVFFSVPLIYFVAVFVFTENKENCHEWMTGYKENKKLKVKLHESSYSVIKEDTKRYSSMKGCERYYSYE